MKECEHPNCSVEFEIKTTKKYCSRNCKDKSNNIKRYKSNSEYSEMKCEASSNNYYKKKNLNKRLIDLTQEDIEKLKLIRPELFENV